MQKNLLTLWEVPVAMLGAERALVLQHDTQLCCTSDLQRRSAPKAGEPNVHVICGQALSAKRCIFDSLKTTGIINLLDTHGDILFIQIMPLSVNLPM